MQQERQLIIEIEEAKAELVECVNSMMQKHKLPFYFIESILKEVYVQVQMGAQSELEKVKTQLATENNVKKEVE